jgi:hypothetical protein
MPIRPENKNRYPKDWPQISQRIRNHAGNKCEECGVPNYEYGGRAPDGTWHKSLPLGEKLLRLEWPQLGDYARCRGWPEPLRIVRIVLTVAHLNHQPEDCRDENLKAWCQRCHNRYDAAERRKGIKARKTAKLAVSDLFDPQA